MAWKKIDVNHFEQKRCRNGELFATRRIAISKDGRTLTEVIERTASVYNLRNPTNLMDCCGLSGYQLPFRAGLDPDHEHFEVMDVACMCGEVGARFDYGSIAIDTDGGIVELDPFGHAVGVGRIPNGLRFGFSLAVGVRVG